MFTPKYTITQKILQNIAQINKLIGKVITRKIPEKLVMQISKESKLLAIYSSTSIEGNPLNIDQIDAALKIKKTTLKDTEREVINYNKALELLNKLIELNTFELTHKTILQIQSIVVEQLQPKHNTGQYRKTSVFLLNSRSGEPIFLPPEHTEVKNLMTKLLHFINKSKEQVDPVVLAGIFHKQFAIIHPFSDGNGRTTRLISTALLAHMKINTFQLFSFENYYYRHLQKYYLNVGELGNYYDIINKIDFTNWLEFFTDGILSELQRVHTKLTAEPVRLKAHLQLILDFIAKNGSISQEEYVKITDRKKSTRAKDLKELIEMNMIVAKGQGKGTYYVFN